MTTWYRAYKKDNNLLSIFSGEAELSIAGRWHHRGTKAVYCSESIALCTLEWLSHNGLSVSGFDYYRYSIEVPDNLVKRFSIEELPSGWNSAPSIEVSRKFAEEKLFSNSKIIAMAIPSVIISEEYNLVINPGHPEFTKIAKTIKSLGKYIAPKRG